MMNRSQPISTDQLAATAFVLMLSPALRLFPSAAAASAGRAAPLAALLAFFPAQDVALCRYSVSGEVPL